MWDEAINEMTGTWYNVWFQAKSNRLRANKYQKQIVYFWNLKLSKLISYERSSIHNTCYGYQMYSSIILQPKTFPAKSCRQISGLLHLRCLAVFQNNELMNDESRVPLNILRCEEYSEHFLSLILVVVYQFLITTSWIISQGCSSKLTKWKGDKETLLFWHVCLNCILDSNVTENNTFSAQYILSE